MQNKINMTYLYLIILQIISIKCISNGIGEVCQDIINLTINTNQTFDFNTSEENCSIKLFRINDTYNSAKADIILSTIEGEQQLFGLHHDRKQEDRLKTKKEIVDLVYNNEIDKANKLGPIYILSLDFRTEFNNDKIIYPAVLSLTKESKYSIYYTTKNFEDEKTVFIGMNLIFNIPFENMTSNIIKYRVETKNKNKAPLTITMMSIGGTSFLHPNVTCENNSNISLTTEVFRQRESVIVNNHSCDYLHFQVEIYNTSTLYYLLLDYNNSLSNNVTSLLEGMTQIRLIRGNKTFKANENDIIFIDAINCELRLETREYNQTDRRFQFLATNETFNLSTVENISYCGINIYRKTIAPILIMEGIEYPIIFDKDLSNITYSYAFTFDSSNTFVIINIHPSQQEKYWTNTDKCVYVYVYFENQKYTDIRYFKIYDSLDVQIVLDKETYKYCASKLCSVYIKFIKKFDDIYSKLVKFTVQKTSKIIKYPEINILKDDVLYNSKSFCFDIKGNDTAEFFINFKSNWGTVKFMEQCYNSSYNSDPIIDILKKLDSSESPYINNVSAKYYIQPNEICTNRLICANVSLFEKQLLSQSNTIVAFKYLLKTINITKFYLGHKIDGNFYNSSNMNEPHIYEMLLADNSLEYEFFISAQEINFEILDDDNQTLLKNEGVLKGVSSYIVKYNSTKDRQRRHFYIYIFASENATNYNTTIYFPKYSFYMSIFNDSSIAYNMETYKKVYCYTTGNMTSRYCYYFLNINGNEDPVVIYVLFEPEEYLDNNDVYYDLLIINSKYINSTKYDIINSGCKGIPENECIKYSNLTDNYLVVNNKSLLKSVNDYVALVKVTINKSPSIVKLKISYLMNIKTTYVEPFYEKYFYINNKTKRTIKFKYHEKNLSNTEYIYKITIEKHSNEKGLLEYNNKRFYLEGAITYIFNEFNKSLETLNILALEEGFVISILYTIDLEKTIFTQLPYDKPYGVSFPIQNNLTLHFYNRANYYDYIDMNIRLREIIYSPVSSDIIQNIQINSNAYYVKIKDLHSLQHGDFSVLKNLTKQFSTTIGKNFTNFISFNKNNEKNKEKLFIYIQLTFSFPKSIEDYSYNLSDNLNNHYLFINTVGNNSKKINLNSKKYFIANIKNNTHYYLDMNSAIKGDKKLKIDISVCNLNADVEFSLLYENNTVFKEKPYDKLLTNLQIIVNVPESIKYLILNAKFNKTDETYIVIKYHVIPINEDFDKFHNNKVLKEKLDDKKKIVEVQFDPFRNSSRSNILIKSFYHVGYINADKLNFMRKDEFDSVCYNLVYYGKSSQYLISLNPNFIRNLSEFTKSELGLSVVSKFDDYKGEEFLYSYKHFEMHLYLEKTWILYLTLGIITAILLGYSIYSILKIRRRKLKNK